ncbi:hypothetical protein GDO86_009449 [Hymenochirus boettgeri]|uniref:Nuclear receptor coactivator 7 n=1 Tax=Hymenochirus boettgeri TaxID=247094 RepID=A0A8T2JG29_9PIPI|nr:hypothetical protein GDO86_009449 [Hymenochirus boettgeri]
MDNKEEKKERRQGYFARLKKKRQAKQSAELAPSNSSVSSSTLQKDDTSKVILSQISDRAPEDEKKKKRRDGKQLKRSEVKKHLSGENQNNKNEKKEKKLVTRKPLGTVEYTATSSDTLNSIALKFNLTPNKLVELNKLFSHTIVPGQVLYVPDGQVAKDSSMNLGALASPLSSDAEYDKLPDAEMARKATKPIQRVLSSTSEEEEPAYVKFIKMNCRYITDGKGVVGGVMIVTPNNVMFDPHKSDPLVIENGCEEYGLICPMEEVVSVALYSDISHMKIKDALPSDIPKDLCPLYRPGEWEDLSSEKDINPFSKFKSLGKEKRKQNGVSGFSTEESKCIDASRKELKLKDVLTNQEDKVQLMLSEQPALQTEQSINNNTSSSDIKQAEISPVEDDFIELVEATALENGTAVTYKDSEVQMLSMDYMESDRMKSDLYHNRTMKVICPEENISESMCTISIESNKKEATSNSDGLQTSPKHNDIELCLCPSEQEKQILDGFLRTAVEGSTTGNTDKVPSWWITTNITEPSTLKQTAEENRLVKPGGKDSDESVDSLSPCSPDGLKEKDTQLDSESELRLWLMKRIQRPIEDLIPSKEEKSKIPPMFLCIKVGKPMRKSFASQSTTFVHQYIRRRKQPEYWFAVPQERVDRLYNFFVQWSPEVYGKDAKDQGFVVVDKDELNMIDNFFSEPSTKSWEIITVEEAKRRKSNCSYCDDEEGEEMLEDFLPDLKQKSKLLDGMLVEKLVHRLPARVQGYPWNLVYSTQDHGTSLKTLYRNLSSIDSPVLLVVKDMDNQVFGAYATHPFRLSDHYYGTGETFLYTFCPDFKVFKWSGENSYFINGDISFLELGGGGGQFGLWLDSDLYHGRSNPCSTFNNDSLSKKEDFIVQDVEVWAFG